MERRTRRAPWIVLLAAVFPACAEPASPEAALPALTEPAALRLGAPERLEAAASPGATHVVLDRTGLGSHAARLTYRATSAWALSATAFGVGEGVDGWRGTAVSAMFVQPVGREAFAAAAGWGRTGVAGDTADSFLLEGSFHHARHQFFARAANVSHSEDAGGDRMYPVTAGTLGYTYATRHGRQEVGIGISVTVFKVPPALEQAYGERPLAWQLHLRVQPAPDRGGH